MQVLLELFALTVLIGFSALYSGSEIGFYSLSSVQVDLDAEGGSRRARVMRWLLRNEAALLVTILIGNNLALELATHVAESLTSTWLGIRGAGPMSAILVTLVLTPLVFVFGEALPKDVFRQRPHALTGLSAPLIALSRVVFWPLERILRLFTLALEKLLRLESIPVAQLAGREAVLGFLAEGRRHGALSESAETLANNALRLKSVPVSEALVPWDSVEVLYVGRGEDEQMETILGSRFSRLPVVESDGDLSEPIRLSQVLGYVHQLEVLHDKAQQESQVGPPMGLPDGSQVPVQAGGGVPRSGSDGEASSVFRKVRPLLELEAEESVSAALGKFRASGRRIGLVVRDEVVLGVVSVNDLLDRISGVVVA